ncbi:MAG: hypothetical protein JST30_15030 [Armatimonadetes bacterium]|nr:hypothetical protein [Armatimonadota bacterium]
MSISTIALLLAARGTVTVELPAAPIETVVAQFGEAARLKLDVERELRPKNLLIRLTDRSVEEGLKLIAEVSGGVWDDTGDGKVLRVDRAAAKRGDGIRRKAFEAEVAKLTDEASDFHTLTSGEAEAAVKEVVAREQGSNEQRWDAYEKDADKTPQRRFLKRVLALTGVRALGDLYQSRRVVFSTNPTRVQRALPTQVWDAYATFLKEAQVQKDAIESVSERRPNEGYYSPLLQQAAVSAERPAAILLVYSRSAMSPQGTFSLCTVHPSGLNDLSQCSIDPTGLQRSIETPRSVVTGLEGDVAFSEHSELAIAAVSPFLGGKTPGADKALAWFRNELADLPKSDVMTCVVSDILIQGARAKKMDVVASVPDFAFMVGAQARRNGSVVKLQAAWDLLLGTGFLDSEVKDGVLTAKTGDKLPLFRTLPKEAVARLCREMSSKKSALDALADYCLGCQDEEEALYGMMMAQLGYKRLRNLAFTANQSFRLMRIYARLDPSARAAAKADGAKIQVGTLGPAGREDLRVLLFEDQPTVSSVPNVDDTGRRPSPEEVHEPTIRLPEGLPGFGELVLTLKDKSSLFRARVWNGDIESATIDPVEPQNLAYDIAYQERVGSEAGVSKFVNGSMQILTLVSRFGPQTFHSAVLRLMPEIESSSLVTWDKLPADQRKTIEEALPNARKAYEGLQQGAPGRIKPLP